MIAGAESCQLRAVSQEPKREGKWKYRINAKQREVENKKLKKSESRRFEAEVKWKIKS